MQKEHPELISVRPTIYLRGSEAELEQLIHVSISNPGSSDPICILFEASSNSISKTDDHPYRYETKLNPLEIQEGISVLDVYLKASEHELTLQVSLKVGDVTVSSLTQAWNPPRRWVVHVVQTSHHDIGYTDLPSSVYLLHDRWLSDALDLAQATLAFPEEAKFRIVIEQFWSLEHFLKTASPEQSARMILLLKSGQFEVNASYANMTSELCSPEELIRSLYPAFNLKRRYGIPLTSAEHNDITGFSWGMSTALLGAGIRLFIPGLPLYYDWGAEGLESFWDQKVILPHGGPGAFWWQSPSGSLLLTWDNGSGCGGDCHPEMPDLPAALERLEQQDYPYSVLRWPVIGGNSDNSPYIPGYSEVIRQWNAKWTYPRLVCSTNARFYTDFIRENLSSLPVFRGELPGQDYPTGAASTAGPTALNRSTHQTLATAEKIAVFSNWLTGKLVPIDRLAEAYQDTILHDEHTWGFHFPAGPAAEASQIEKAIHAYRAAALSHEILQVSLAGLADIICSQFFQPDQGPSFFVLVFNPISNSIRPENCRTDIIRMPLRAMENSGRVMVSDPSRPGCLTAVGLSDRNHVLLPESLLVGKFDLVDVSTGEVVPYQLIRVENPQAPTPFSAERVGLGSGTRRLALFENPAGIKTDLVFLAQDIPAYGYKTYLLRPRPEPARFHSKIKSTSNILENDYFRLEVDKKTGGISSLFDREAGRELVDPSSPHAFNTLLVRDPEGCEWISKPVKIQHGEKGLVCHSIEIIASARGHPLINQVIRLYSELKIVDVSAKILKDATPLLDTHLAFPFQFEGPHFRYEGVLANLDPITDFLPGSQSDCLAIQNWVKVTDGSFSILWSSLDAPLVRLARCWHGYVSQAHRCLVPQSIHQHRRLTPANLDRGWIYSSLTNNNFGTNFSVSQVGEFLFRYRFTSCTEAISDAAASRWGQSAVTPLEPIFTTPMPGGTPPHLALPPSGRLLQVEGDGITLLTVKQAEDGRGFILHLWNTEQDVKNCQISLFGKSIKEAYRVSSVEEDQSEIRCEKNFVSLDVAELGLATVRMILE